jgi:hypothetical protein
MGVKENNVFKECVMRVCKFWKGSRVFRNNVGTGWTGPGFTMKPGQTYTAKGGERVLTHASRIEFGLMVGSGDGIGWKARTIMPSDVPAEGLRIAQFLSLEAKTKTGRPSKEQLNWRDQVQAAGGIALIVNDPDQIEIELP